ncbi:hypothetical protein D3C71_2247070 [compost metagenome]
MTTSPGPGVGSGRVVIVSGWPTVLNTADLIIVLRVAMPANQLLDPDFGTLSKVTPVSI